jgi:hypothetical protein
MVIAFCKTDKAVRAIYVYNTDVSDNTGCAFNRNYGTNGIDGSDYGLAAFSQCFRRFLNDRINTIQAEIPGASQTAYAQCCRV